MDTVLIVKALAGTQVTVPSIAFHPSKVGVHVPSPSSYARYETDSILYTGWAFGHYVLDFVQG